MNESAALSRTEASAAVADLGWRCVLGALQTAVPVGSLSAGAEMVARVVAGCGDGAGLAVDLRPGLVELRLQSLAAATVTAREVELAGQITAVLDELDARPSPLRGPSRSVQLIEVAVDALDIAAIRPFWKAALGYVDEPGRSGPEDALVDPAGQGPSVWFQQMDAPRPQRNRIHLDISVPHDEAPGRIADTLAAGGTLLSDAEAPAFWVLADAEGNEVCVTTWQGRDG